MMTCVLLCVCIAGLDLAVYVFWTCFMFPLSLLAFTGSSWTNWYGWWIHSLQWLAPIRVLRRMWPFRVMSCYGVFPPHSFAPLKHSPVFEGSDDGVTWQRYLFKFQICSPTSRPPHVAPYHPRFDFLMFYLAFSADWHVMMPVGEPYSAAAPSLLRRIAYRLLSDEDATGPISHAFGHNPFLARGRPPKYVRVRVFGVRPHWQSGGVYWKEQAAFVSVPPLCLTDPGCAYDVALLRSLCDPVVPSGDVLYTLPDAGVWREACPSVRKLVSVYESSGDLETAVTTDCGPSWVPITKQEYRLFWSVLVDEVVGSKGWADLAVIRKALKARVTPEQWVRQRLVYGALQAIWLHKAPSVLFWHKSAEVQSVVTAAAPSVFHLSLLGNLLMCRGRVVFEKCLGELRSQWGGGVDVGAEVWRVGGEAKLLADPSAGFVMTGVFEGPRLKLCSVLNRMMATTLKMDFKPKEASVSPMAPGALYCLHWLEGTPTLGPTAAWDSDMQEDLVLTEKRDGRWYFLADEAASAKKSK